ncbi:MAG TPA: flagellar basal-body rod protein FlgG [Chthonomonadales bacterium]|nr:flagellar basal-body rod protein FlgG [Chthonomonadales bacterium]
MRALYTSATGMIAQQFNLDVIAHNLANVNTTGFKRTTAHFQDLLYETIRTPGAASGNGGQLPTGAQIGLGVSGGTTSQIFTQGTLQQTGGEFDVAIKGEGFLRVLLPDGTIAYTRDGALNIDAQGRLVTVDGFPIQPEILIPPDKTSVTIAPDGTVSVTRPGQANAEQVGQLQLTRFVNPAGLLNAGGNLYKPTAASGDPVDDAPGQNGLGVILHKMIETANVEIVEEMIRMITVQRAYETNSKAIQAADEMLQGANNLKR